MITLLSFVLAIGLLVFVHEYGHYWVAKRCGVGVLTFSIGFGRPIWQWQRGETTWQIALIPLGGFVRLMDEREAPVEAGQRQRAFNRQAPWKKIAVVAAGPLANLIFAVLAFSLCYWHGVPTMQARVAMVTPASIAAQAGLVSGDKVLAVADQPVATWEQLQIALFAEAGNESVALKVQSRAGGERMIDLQLSKLPREEFDQQLLLRLGLSPFALLPVIEEVQAGSAAAQAGLQAGDRIVQINGHLVADWSAVQSAVKSSAGRPLNLRVDRQDRQLQFQVTPAMATQADGSSQPRLGISPRADAAFNQQQLVQEQYAMPAVLWVGAEKTWQMSLMTVQMFGKMLVGTLSPKQISGPLGIAEYAGLSAQLGWLAYLQFLALISISLGVLNLLPVPILDGGHLLYHSYELLTGKTVSVALTEWLQRIGLALLLTLMAVALFNDVTRLLLH
ncbi:RIP metalloprotease RseP [Chitinibacter sp. ZOR0017]|uniref:RIP metalloprotease RseP n=1 Tax=Chitinibacter sp. ZOR0017 TaxID=1339254 RepID=UPI000646F7E4|nr:RIP metalloprotease RseP [Chitinibacter sp. ZOR0017]